MSKTVMRFIFALCILTIGGVSLLFVHETKTEPSSSLSLLAPARVSASSTTSVLYTGTEARSLQIPPDFYLRAGTWTEVEREPENLPQFKNGSESYQTAVLALEDNRGYADKLLFGALDEFIRVGGAIELADEKAQSGYFPAENGPGGIIRMSVDPSTDAMAFAQKELAGSLMKFKANQGPELDFQYLLDDLWLAMSNRVAVMQRMQHPAMNFRRPPIGLEDLSAQPRDSIKRTAPEEPCQNCAAFSHSYNSILFDEGRRLDRALRKELFEQPKKLANGQDNPKFLGAAYIGLSNDPVFADYFASFRYKIFLKFTDRLIRQLSAVSIAEAASQTHSAKGFTPIQNALAANTQPGIDAAKIANDIMTTLLTTMSSGSDCQTFADVPTALEQPPENVCGLTLTGNANGEDGADGIGELPFVKKITITGVDYTNGLPSREMSYLPRLHELEIKNSRIDRDTFVDSKNQEFSVFPALTKETLRADTFPTGTLTIAKSEALREFFVSYPTMEGETPMITFSNLPKILRIGINDVTTQYSDPDQQPSELHHPPLSIAFSNGVFRDASGTINIDLQRAALENAPDFSGAHFNPRSDVLLNLAKNNIATYGSIEQITQKLSGLEPFRGNTLPKSATINLSGNPICDPSKNDDEILEQRWRTYKAFERANAERQRKKFAPIAFACPAPKPPLPGISQPLRQDRCQSAVVQSSKELREYDEWSAALACTLSISGADVKGAVRATDIAKFFNINSFAMTKTNAVNLENLSGKRIKSVQIYGNPILSSAPNNLCTFASTLETLALNTNALTTLPQVGCLTMLNVAMDASENRLTSVPDVSAMGSANPRNKSLDVGDKKPTALFGAGFGKNRLSAFTPPRGNHWGWIALYNNVMKGSLDFRSSPLMGGAILTNNWSLGPFPTLPEGGRMTDIALGNAGVFTLPSQDNLIKATGLTSLHLDGFNPVCFNAGLQKIIDGVLNQRRTIGNPQPLLSGCDVQKTTTPIASASIRQNFQATWLRNLFAPRQANAASGVRPISFSDTFTRTSSNQCLLGRADNGKGGSPNPSTWVYYIPVSAGATISNGVLKNIGKDFGGVQFTGYSGNICRAQSEIIRTGLDLMTTMNIRVPKDALGNITAAGPYFRGSYGVNAGQSVGGPGREGYWVLLDSRGIVRIQNLQTGAFIATSLPLDSFDPNATHRMTTTNRGDWLSVVVDYSTVLFTNGTSYSINVPIPRYGYTINSNTLMPAGIVFGAPDNRGKIGGQTVDDLMVSPITPNFCNPVMGFFCGAGFRCSSDPLPEKPWKMYAEDYGTCLRSSFNDWTAEDQRIAAAQQKALKDLEAELAAEAKALKDAQTKDLNDAKKQSDADLLDQRNREKIEATSTPRCGDKTIDYYAGEECESGNLGGQSCSDLDADTQGTLRCANDCTFDSSQCVLMPVDARRCTPNVQTIIAQCLPGEICSPLGICEKRVPVCGDAIVDAGEECDRTNILDKQCRDVLPNTTGALKCLTQCRFDYSGCQRCGNEVREGTEQCDGLDLGNKSCRDVKIGSAGSLRCSADCTYNSSSCLRSGCVILPSGAIQGCNQGETCVIVRGFAGNVGRCSPLGLSQLRCSEPYSPCVAGYVCSEPANSRRQGSCEVIPETCNVSHGLLCPRSYVCSSSGTCERQTQISPAPSISMPVDFACNREPSTNFTQALLNPAKVCNLDLSNQFVPLNLPAISGLEQLQTLSLRATSLVNLPAEIGALKNLETLDLSKNNLTTLPAEIGNLTNLKTLILTDNKTLLTLPEEIKNLTKLQDFYVTGTALPASERAKVSPTTVIHF